MIEPQTALSTLLDYGIFAVYGAISCQLVSTWWRFRHCQGRRQETLLSLLLLFMIFSVLVFVAANAYLLSYTGQTLLSMRIFQMFVIANGFVYWLILTLIRRGGSLNGAAT